MALLTTIKQLEKLCNFALLTTIKQLRKTGNIYGGKDRVMIFTVSLVVTIALLGIIIADFQSDPQQNNAQTVVKPTTVMTVDSSMTSPQHDMAKMIMGQDGSTMNSDQTSAEDAHPYP